MKERSGYFFDILHIFTLTAFAVAQPLFDLLGRQAEFFVARQADSIDIVLLVAVLILLLPGVLCLVRVLVQPLSVRLRRSVQLVLVAGLLVLIVLPALNGLPGLSAHSQLGVAVLVALLCTGLYARYAIVGSFVSMLSPAVLVFPAMFLGGSGANKLLFPEQQSGTGDVHINNPVPIVMVVFDELPLISLLDGQRQIGLGTTLTH